MLAKELREAGAYTQVEYRPLDEEGQRPDLTVVLPEETIFMDVVVSHPAAPSRTSLQPLAASRYAEARKHAAYAGLAQAHGARVLAYAVESYGAFGEQAMEIIQKIRNTYQSSHPDGDFNQPLHRRLATSWSRTAEG